MSNKERLLDDVVVGGLSVLTDESARSHGLLVAFTDRHGGVSDPPYDSLNLGSRIGDDPQAVERNRALVADALGFEADAVARVRQVHGARVVRVADETGSLGEADVLASDAPRRVLTVTTADCVPVVIAGDGGVAIAHAGWRGLVAGAVEAAVDAIGGAHSGWVGPSIRACCYEVGPDVTSAFAVAGLPVAAEDRVDPGRAAVVALRRAGVAAIKVADLCTSCDPRFFSYRRDGVTGRQGAFVARLEA